MRTQGDTMPPSRRSKVRPITVLVVIGVALGATAFAGTLDDTDGLDREIGRLVDEVAAMEAAGLGADHPKIAMLEAEIDMLVEAKENPGPEPTPEDASPNPGIGDVPSAETECEPLPGITDPIENWKGIRCVSVAQKDLDALMLFLTPDGWALAVVFSGDASGVTSSKILIPRLPNLASSSITVDAAGGVHVADEHSETVISTEVL